MPSRHSIRRLVEIPKLSGLREWVNEQALNGIDMRLARGWQRILRDAIAKQREERTILQQVGRKEPAEESGTGFTSIQERRNHEAARVGTSL